MAEKTLLTPEERRMKRIEKLKAKLQKEEALVNAAKRKERNGQLIAWGVLIEEMYKAADEQAKQRWIDGAKKHLSGRNLERALAGFERIQSS